MADILTKHLHTEALTGCIYHLILAKARIHAGKRPLSIPIILLEKEEIIMLTLLRSLYRGSYMSAHVLLNLLNELGKKR